MKIGDRVVSKYGPYAVTITDVGNCEEQGCPEQVISFADPKTGIEDVAHASEFIAV